MMEGQKVDTALLDRLEELLQHCDPLDLEAVFGKAFLDGARRRLELLSKWKELKANVSREAQGELQEDFLSLREELGFVEPWERCVLECVDLRNAPALLAALYVSQFSLLVNTPEASASVPCIVGPRLVSLDKLYLEFGCAFLQKPSGAVVVETARFAALVRALVDGVMFDSSRPLHLTFLCRNEGNSGASVGCSAAYHLAWESRAESMLRDSCFLAASRGSCECNQWPECAVKQHVAPEKLLQVAKGQRFCPRCMVEEDEVDIKQNLHVCKLARSKLCAKYFCPNHAGEGGDSCEHCDLGSDDDSQ